MKNISEYIQEKLDSPSNSQLRVSYYWSIVITVVVIFFYFLTIALEGPMQKSRPQVILEMNGIFYFFLYMYPIGVIFNGYLSTIQLKNVKKEHHRNDGYKSHQYEDQEKKYHFLLGIALIPVINVIGWIPILCVYPPALIIKSIYNIFSSAKTYIFESFKNAVEKIADKNIPS